MISTRRALIAAVLAAGLSVGACHRNSSDAIDQLDAPAVKRAQDELTGPAWLRMHLPPHTVAYLRLPSPWAAIGGVPTGRPLDAALASEQNLKAVAAVRDALTRDATLAQAGVTPYLLPLLTDLRSPLELVAIDPLGTPSPGSQVLVCMRLAEHSVPELYVRFARLAGPGSKLKASLDTAGRGRLAGMPVHFDTVSGRLFMLAASKDQAPTPAQLESLLAKIQQGSADTAAAAAMGAQEQRIDQSGEGLFGWVSVRGLGALAAGVLPTGTLGTLPGDLAAKAQSIAFGAGAVDGHGQLALIVHAPQARLLGYLAPTQFMPQFQLAGKPRWVASMALPSSAQMQALEGNLSLDFGAKGAAVRQREAQWKQSAGFGPTELMQWIGPELVSFEDEAGEYTAVRVRDRDALYAALTRLAKSRRGSLTTSTIDGARVHALTVDMPAATPKEPAPDAPTHGPQDTAASAVALLASRVQTHLYWMEEGDFLIFAQVPQALADRVAAKPDNDAGAWLKAHAASTQPSLFAFTTVSHAAQRKAYYSYLHMLQIIGDISGQPIDLGALPAAHYYHLPSEGVIGMQVGASADDLSIGMTYEQQPLELLGGGNGTMAAVAGVGIMAAVAIPAYQDYIVRSQVSEGLTLAQDAEKALVAYREKHQQWPASNTQAGLPTAAKLAGKHVDSVRVLAGGMLAVHYGATPPHQANSRIAGKTLELHAIGGQHGQWTWQCRSDDLAARDLPQACRAP